MKRFPLYHSDEKEPKNEFSGHIYPRFTPLGGKCADFALEPPYYGPAITTSRTKEKFVSMLSRAISCSFFWAISQWSIFESTSLP